jgi:hypothetical protein
VALFVANKLQLISRSSILADLKLLADMDQLAVEWNDISKDFAAKNSIRNI